VARTDRTTTWGTSTESGRSTSSATAPAAAAAGPKSWPSNDAPGTQQKSAPGPTARESYAMPVTSTCDAPGGTSTPSTPSRRRSRRIDYVDLRAGVEVTVVEVVGAAFVDLGTVVGGFCLAEVVVVDGLCAVADVVDVVDGSGAVAAAPGTAA